MGQSLGWYEQEFGWPTTGTVPPALVTGVRFDVLDVPAPAGFAVLRRFPRTGPVILDGARTRFLVAAGSADELPGLLDWLEWGGVPLDLEAQGPGGLTPAPAPPRRALGRVTRQRAASERACPMWLRPPMPGPGTQPSLPALAVVAADSGLHGPDGGRPARTTSAGSVSSESRSAGSGSGSGSFPGSFPGSFAPDFRSAGSGSVNSGSGGCAGSGSTGSGSAVGLVALVSALANACHRLRLQRAGLAQSLAAQPCSRSYASRMVAGTRPRSFTS